MYAEPYKEGGNRPPPKPKRSFMSDFLPAMLVVCVALAGVNYWHMHHVPSSLAVAPPPPGLDALVPLGVAEDHGPEGWILYPRRGWRPPVGESGMSSLCAELVDLLALAAPQTIDLIGADGEDFGRCRAPAL